MMDKNKLKGTKKCEIPYLEKHLSDNSKSVLIVGERRGEDDMISPTIKDMGFENVTTTDIIEKERGSWLDVNTKWEHITKDFMDYDESMKYDYVVSISVFEHFGFWFRGNRMANGLALNDDMCKWNHDLRGVAKACRLLKDKNSKLIITLPAGPYMNYETTGEPFLRYYDIRRQEIVKGVIQQNECVVFDEHFYFTEDFEQYEEMHKSICEPQYYGAINPHSPNLIWAFSVRLNNNVL